MSLWRKRQKSKERNVLEQALDALYLTVQYCEFPQGGGVLREVRKAINDIKDELAQPEQKPVAWINEHELRVISENVTPTVGHRKLDDDDVPLYTTPPQRKPLTRDDIIRMAKQAGFPEPEHITSGGDFRCSPDLAYLVALVEAAHGIKE